MISTLHKWGFKSSHMYTAGIASVGLSFAAWATSNRLEDAGLERADRWGIFIGEWAPTFMAMGLALRFEETRELAGTRESGRRESMDERVTTPQSASMR